MFISWVATLNTQYQCQSKQKHIHHGCDHWMWRIWIRIPPPWRALEGDRCVGRKLQDLDGSFVVSRNPNRWFALATSPTETKNVREILKGKNKTNSRLGFSARGCCGMLLNRRGQENVQMQQIGTDIGSHYFWPYINQQERRIQHKQKQQTQQQKHTFWSIGQANIIHLVGIRTYFFHTQILAIGSWSSPPEILQAWRPFF